MTRSQQNRLFGRKCLTRGISALCVAVALNLTADYARAATPYDALDGTGATFRGFAHELLAGIGSASVQDIPALGGYGKPRIAVAPFRNKDKAVSPSLASELNTRLLAELTQQGSPTYHFVARENLKEIIHEIDSIGELDQHKNTHVTDLLRNARVDILIVGKLRKTKNSVVASYKALSVENGIVFAATRPQSILLTHPLPRTRPVLAKTLRPVPRARLADRGRRPVFHAQRLLFVLGYDPGLIDGRMRPSLRHAIRAYQRDFGQVANGRMTRRLIRHLRQSVREEGKTALALP